LPDFDEPFDHIVTVNSLWFWPDPPARLEELRKRLRPGGTIAVGAQPRSPGADDATAVALGDEIAAMLENAGFGQARVERLDLTPPAMCIIAEA
jgi:SAM-dependent methyltransferase